MSAYNFNHICANYNHAYPKRYICSGGDLMFDKPLTVANFLVCGYRYESNKLCTLVFDDGEFDLQPDENGFVSVIMNNGINIIDILNKTVFVSNEIQSFLFDFANKKLLRHKVIGIRNFNGFISGYEVE